MHVLKDGTIKQPSRKWYSASETREIYDKGGHVVLKLAQPKSDRKRGKGRKHG